MTNRIILVLAAMTLLGHFVMGQTEDVLQGKVTSADEDGTPLIGANIFWLNSDVGTVSDLDGQFTIPITTESNQLVISYIGYQSDTIKVQNGEPLDIRLSSGNLLNDVEVVHRRKGTEYSFLEPRQVQQINEKELLKAACCNLSESFETNPSVDVAFTDAVTGTRQIQMLGLAGPNIQITRENIPYIRGLSSLFGLTFVPGTWVEGMQLSKGTGSVVNGFESIAGQINIELRKPDEGDRLHLNVYANESSRFEANANFATSLNDQWSTALLLHAKTNTRRMDRNEDGFMDNPLGDNLIAMNRWKYIGENGLRVQFGINGTYIRSTGGQMGAEKNTVSSEQWGMGLDVDRMEGFLKVGKVYEHIPWRSWAIQASAVRHHQDSYFGVRTYDAVQNSLYINLMYQSIIANTNHQVLMGLSWQYDDYDESFEDVEYDRVESVPGGFFEYTYGGHDKLSLVAGIRADYHNQYGFFMTPRLHLRHAFSDQLVGRISLGRGQRTANILSENNGLMASSRIFSILGDGSAKPYGLDPEVAWNTGANLVYSFQNNQHPGALSFDFYRTAFQNQIVVDLDDTPQGVSFYNLDGQSFSNSFQLQLDYELLNRLDARIAYRWYDVKTTYTDELLDKPLTSRHRLFLNLAYETESNWKFDYTVNWQGKKRLPRTESNPLAYQLGEYSPSFVVMNAQITKTWWESFEVYIGFENILNYRQKDPILASEDPFGEYFDSSLTWGPIFGRNTYLGLRYRI